MRRQACKIWTELRANSQRRELHILCRVINRGLPWRAHVTGDTWDTSFNYIRVCLHFEALKRWKQVFLLQHVIYRNETPPTAGILLTQRFFQLIWKRGDKCERSDSKRGHNANSNAVKRTLESCFKERNSAFYPCRQRRTVGELQNNVSLSDWYFILSDFDTFRSVVASRTAATAKLLSLPRFGTVTTKAYTMLRGQSTWNIFRQEFLFSCSSHKNKLVATQNQLWTFNSSFPKFSIFNHSSK